MLPRGPMVWNLGRASQRSKDLNFDGLKFGRASQRSDGVESWTCFPKVQRLNFGHASQRSDGLILDILPKGPMDLNLDVLPRGLMD